MNRQAIQSILGLVLALGVGAASLFAEKELKFETAVFYGDAGDEVAGGMEVADGRLTIAGAEKFSDWKAAALSYALPPQGAPQWSFIWPEGAETKTASANVFAGIAKTSEGLYFAGKSWLPSKESTGLLSKFSLNQDGSTKARTSLWTVRTQFFSKDQNEVFQALEAAEEDSITYLYAAGSASSEKDNSTAILAKYDTEGKLQWRQFLTETKKFHKAAGVSLAVLNQHIYVLGYLGTGDKKTAFDNIPLALHLWKYDSAGKFIWKKKVFSDFVFERYASSETRPGLAASNNHLYLVGGKAGKGDKRDVVISKYDEKGDLVWEKTWKGELEDGRKGRAWAAAVAVGEDRIYVAGQFQAEGSAAGDQDIFLLEVDKEYGFVLAVHAYGDKDMLEQVTQIEADKSGVYLLGMKTSLKAKTPESDLALFRYKPVPVTSVLIDIEPLTKKNLVALEEIVKDKKKGTVRKPKTVTVAILSKGDFKAATDVNTHTLTFGRTGNEPSWKNCSMQDANQDGVLDLLCNFKTKFTGYKGDKFISLVGDKEGILKGHTKDGGRIKSVDFLEVQEVAPEPITSPQPEEPKAPETFVAPEITEDIPETISEPEPIVTQPVVLASTVAPSTTTVETAEATTSSTALTPIVDEKPIYEPPVIILSPDYPITTSTATAPYQQPLITTSTSTATTSPVYRPTILSSSSTSAPRALFSQETQQESPDTSDKAMSLARMYGDSGRKALVAGNFKEAVSLYREAVKLNPKSPEIHRDLAQSLAKDGNIPEAIQYYNKALNLSPSSPEIHQDLALLLMQQGKNEEAKIHFSEVLKLDPANDAARRYLNLLSEAPPV